MKALVTGANGFLGRSVVRRLLAAGVAVRALVRPGRSEHCAGTEIVTGDLADDATVATAVSGVDWVVHAAARVDTKGSWESFAEANIRGTRRVIRAACNAGVGRIVHISSLGVYAVPRAGVIITEDSPYESESSTRGHYSRSKLAADRLALREAQRGAPVVVLRPGLLYGPGKRPPLARQSFTVKGVRLLLASPAYTLPMAYVDNVADAVFLALNCPDAVGQAFTVVDENIRQHEYLTMFRAASGEQWRSLFLPVGAVAAATLLMERGLRLARRRPPFTYYQVRRATDSAWYDCARAQRVLGWTPAVGVPEGLRRCFDALRQASATAPAADALERPAA